MKTIRDFKRVSILVVFLVIGVLSSIAQTVSFYVVKKGDTIESIAKKYNVSKDILLTLNQDASKGIYEGMELQIPSGAGDNQTTTENYTYNLDQGTKTYDKSQTDFSFMGLAYYNFDGVSCYGLTGSCITPYSIGLDMGIRSSLKDKAPFNYDFGINYSYPFVNENDVSAFLVIGGGPSFRGQEVYNEKGDTEIKMFIDAFIYPRLVFRYKKLFLSAGYFYWAPQFKFGKDDGGVGGFSASLGLNI